MVDAMATNGMAELGYEYINLDDWYVQASSSFSGSVCHAIENLTLVISWADQERNSSTGELQPVPSEFPSGMAVKNMNIKPLFTKIL